MVMNKFGNKSSIQAMKWGKMCIQNIPWRSQVLLENANVWGISKYYDFLWRINQSGPLQKYIIELWDALTPN
jgi:hypothetical protein